MSQRTDIHKILIIGSGPIIIGQACEFDYSGTQACKALRSLGYEIVLVNSNPATIMTDPEMADVTYIEPLNVNRLEQIIAKERPDALLPNLGGQSGLNLCSELYNAGVLDKYNVQVIGVQVDAIERGEDRVEFKQTMDSLGIEMARSQVAYSVDEALEIADKLGYPVVLRPAYTMGGAGGGLVYNKEELKTVCARGLQASLVHQVLVEESVMGWEELELEVVRDKEGNMITVCFIENIDPMGVHTGDSFCAAPMLTISQEVMDRLQEQAYKIVDAIQVIGGTNVQFAHDPVSDRIIVIEINPRTSRSSALASKATGFPIALVSAKLASGLTLKDIPCGKYGTLDKYKPDGDYVVIKFARWAFEKFKGVEDKLGTQMRAVGEVMSIGKTYKEAFQKAIRSLEKGRYGLGYVKNFHDMTKEELLKALVTPSSERHFQMYEALRKGATVDELFELTHVKRYFIEQMKELVEEEEAIAASKGSLPDDALLTQAKKDGFSDKYLSEILGIDEDAVREKREALGVVETWDKVHVSGTENSAYYYSTYNAPDNNPVSSDKPKIMILGGGPNRIGQGIEFDYCCVHAAQSLKKLGFETIIVNCNPETVSTDYDTSDKLYFEPLTLEDVLSIYKKEKPVGVIAQFGGQTPLNLASDLQKNGVKILGTSPEVIDLAEDRDQFRAMMDKLGIPMPESGMATTVEEAKAIANKIGYPVMVRPSYVLGGRGMEVVYDDDAMTGYMNAAVGVTPDRPILIDRFLHNALECEADAISDGTHAYVPAVMEHIELAGIHSGDSACILPSKHIPADNLETIKEYTRKIAEEMHVVGLMNMQYAIEDGKVFVLEANPRASRTVPLVSKVCGIRMVPIATDIITAELTGRKSPVPELKDREIPYFGVKEAVFPFNMFQEVDPLLGPEMRSTGEVLGLSRSLGGAFFKAEEGAKADLPLEGTVLISVNKQDKEEVVEIAKSFANDGFKLIATEGTCKIINDAGIECERVKKLQEGRPNILDLITNGDIQLIVNSPVGKDSATDDSYLRKAAIKAKIPYITTIAAASAAADGIRHLRKHKFSDVKSLQEWHKEIKEV
ncbi:carbamoyl-phosphate synthase large subunit [Eubacterium ruminantium]|uniref:Carbamoyl-phosphate synthase large subunit n=1 Tax=Eubacterium ruminantium TaxID=42322 RepID=A0A1T4LC82_9FIRM|nr:MULTISPECIES: carbamoyl-phosphate synthase large subunit [Eubacterium]MCR5368284.1 carbamoyl-phosphate synthase large subunit [Eubacterium sp.]SCW44956.1 carbamoyl-phosphate synthase large subunit [Eubacterium ruminantium]SDM75155.1 carbamoyl-phosphate synthase large subunit [Eubacterium ruminantium]SJZ52266.1 carbamoyl-phosphate synthase large subunit [Eubacterium ruminantium]